MWGLSWDILNPFAWFVMPSLGFGAAGLITLALVAAILLLGGSGFLNLAAKIGTGIWEIVYPGLKNIAENGSSILVMLGCMYGAYLYADAQSLETRRELTKQRDYFARELQGYKKTLATTREELRRLQGAANRINKKLQ